MHLTIFINEYGDQFTRFLIKFFNSSLALFIVDRDEKP